MSKTYHFSDLKLLPGARIDLRSEQFKQFKGIGLYVGYRQGKSLIVSTPIQGGKPLSCKLGTSVVLRFFASHLGSACAFRSEVKSIATTPYPYLHLSEPETIEIGEVRNSIRANVSLDAQVMSDYDGGTTAPASINDLSIDGAKIHSAQVLGRNGNHIKISTTVTVFGKEEVLIIKGIIRSVTKQGHNDYMYGVQFVDMPQVDKLMVYSFVTTSLLL